uniref:Amine oxidase domain-containing protein n=1 Tax=Xiphophorus couchianus TaxID=32473 RepID=A0A3B5LM70_9TELE
MVRHLERRGGRTWAVFCGGRHEQAQELATRGRVARKRHPSGCCWRPRVTRLVAVEKRVAGWKSRRDQGAAEVHQRLELSIYFIDSVCRGVFAGDCKKLSVRSCFPWLYMAEQQRGSLTLGFLLGSGSAPVIVPGHLAQRAKREAWAQWSLKRGVETLPESIAEFLQQSGKVELHRDAAVRQIIPTTSGWKWLYIFKPLRNCKLFSCTPLLPSALSCILPPSCQGLVQQLQDISTVTVAVASLEYEGSILPVTGFGHLVPSWEDPGLLGIVYDSVPFPQHNRQTGQTTRLTVMMGGAWFQNVFGAPQAVSADSLLARATEAVCCHLGHCVAPSWSNVALHRDCIPQYHLGHFQRVDTMRAFIKDNNLLLSLIGSAYDGVSVNDVIFSGRTAVAELLGSGV